MNRLFDKITFYKSQIAEATEYFLEEKTPEFAWALVESLGLARLYGACTSGLVDDRLNIQTVITQAFGEDPLSWLNKAIIDYLNRLDNDQDEWKEEDDELIIGHVSTVAAYQWLAEMILESENLLPEFVSKLDELGTKIISINRMILAQIHNFSAGQSIAQFMCKGVKEELVTENFIFLSKRFLETKKQGFIIPLSSCHVK